MNHSDPDILREFVAESGALIERLGQDFDQFRTAPSAELVNRLFRSLHTIKGSADFQALQDLVAITHAAEGALSAVRCGRALVGPELMRALDGAFDVLRLQHADLSAGRELTKADDALLGSLTLIASCVGVDIGPGESAAKSTPTEPVDADASDCAEPEISLDDFPATEPDSDVPFEPPTCEQVPVSLGDQKAGLVGVVLKDLDQLLDRAEQALTALPDLNSRDAAWTDLRALSVGLHKAAVFFEVDVMQRLTGVLVATCEAPVPPKPLDQALPRLLGIIWLLREQTGPLAQNQAIVRPVDTLCAALSAIGRATVGGEITERPRRLAPGASATDALAADRVIAAPAVTEVVEPATTGPTAEQTLTLVYDEPAEHAEQIEQVQPTDQAEPAGPDPALESAIAEMLDPASVGPAPAEPVAAEPTHEPAEPSVQIAAEPAESEAEALIAPGPLAPRPEAPAPASTTADARTLHIGMSRLDALMQLVGELSRETQGLGALARSAGPGGLSATSLRDGLGAVAGELERLSTQMQTEVMHARMQPIGALFARFGRLVTELGRQTGKRVRLVVKGAETEVDAAAVDALANPLVHMLRNAVDHGIEPPEERARTGKDPCGLVTLSAQRDGNRVLVSVADDGRGLDRQKIGAKAVERALVKPADLARLPEREVYEFIFHPGFSTAPKITEISGRGVGMDVVRADAERLGGSIDLRTLPGQGATVTISIPLAVAVLQVLVVRIGAGAFALPVPNVIGVVRPAPGTTGSVLGLNVLHWRGQVLPVISGAELFINRAAGAGAVGSAGKDGKEAGDRGSTPYVVVVGHGEDRIGLAVTKPLGRQEIVVRPIPDQRLRPGPVCGVGACEQGGSALVIDAARLLEAAERRYVHRRRTEQNGPSRGRARPGAARAA